MKESLFLLLGCLVGCLKGDYSVTFHSNGGDADSTKLYVRTDFGIGGQPNLQALDTVRIFLNDGAPNPQLLNNRTCGANNYNPSFSPTFKWTSSFPGGVYGTESIIFGDPIVLNDTKIRVLNDDCNPDNSFVSLRPNQGGNDFTFLGDFAVQQPNPIIVINFEQIGDNGTLLTNGTIAVANKATNLCQNDWAYMPAKEVDNHDSWSLEVEQLTYNKDFLSSPINAKLSIDSYNIYLPEPYFTKLVKQLGISTDGFVDCNVSTNNIVILKLNGSYVKLGPKEYLDHSTVAQYGLCKSRFRCQQSINSYLTLPLTIFRNYCLLLDYKQKQIGVALSTKQTAESTASFELFKD
ncbi:hypothetical protein M3Y97_00293700 [Aphelenchoides bicaudatus]|nr:hypothetical protein M3Y97_00293700 [Aphelenchoides bicaudatus]